MKAIPCGQLIKMLSALFSEEQSVSEGQIIKLFNKYGDEWFAEGCQFELCINNEAMRRRVIESK